MLSPSDYNNAVPQFLNGDYAGSAISPTYIEPPSASHYRRGTEPFETLPAQWWNWFGNQFTARFNKLNIYVKNIFNELAQLLTLVNMSPDGTEQLPTTTQLKTAFRTEYPKYVALTMYPVGSLYWTSKAPDDGGDPNELFGGTWVQIKDCFVWAKGDNDTVNATGGAKTHTITANELPTHTHAIGGTTGSESSHTHGLGSHTHKLTNGTATATSTVSQPGSRKVAYSGDKADGKIGMGSGMKLQATSSPSTVISVTTSIGGKTDGPSTNTSGAGSSHSHTLPANTGNNTTQANAMSIMPPYVVKYCWERTE